MRDGNLVVIDSIFTNNQAAPLGPDTGGGAIYVLGSKGGVWISDSTFTDNQGSNAGAVGGLFAELNIYNSLFTGNKATGNGANGNDPTSARHEQRPEPDRLGRQRRRDLQRRQRRQRHPVRRRRHEQHGRHRRVRRRPVLHEQQLRRHAHHRATRR